MSKETLNLKNSLSIEELETRHELTVLLPSEGLEGGVREHRCEVGEEGAGGSGGDPQRCDDNDEIYI